MDLLFMLILPIYEYGICFHLFVSSSISFKIYFIDYAMTVVPCYLHFIPLHPVLFPSTIIPSPQFMSMGHTCKFIGFSFPILFLISPCLFCIYHLCFLLPVPFPPFSPLPFPTDNLPCDLYFCESVPVVVVCSAHFYSFRFGCWQL